MDNLGFNLFDVGVIGLILLLSIKGLLSGFIKELFNAIGLIGGLFIASYYKKLLATYLHDNFLGTLSMPLLELISLLVIFLAIFIVAKLIYKLIESLSSADYLSGASRLGGMLVKMITLFFVFSLIVFGLSSKPQVVNKFKNTLDSSRLYPLLKSSGALILNTSNEVVTNIKDIVENNQTNIKDTNNSVVKEENNSSVVKEDNNESNITTNKTTQDINKTTSAKEESKNLENNKTKDLTH
jgi:membrane protein required for colicin V production